MAHEKEDALSKEIENAGSEPAFYSPQEEKALIRKIDLVLMPMMWLMYLLSYLDRTNIGNAKISGMETDLDLSSNEYSISLVVFFIGYVVFEVPSNLLLSRIRPSLFLSGIMALWGTLTCVMAAIKNFKHLVVLRAIIGKLTRFLPVLYHKTDNTITGCVEAGFAPGVLMVIASWYKQTEQSKRFGIYITAAVLSGAFGGLIAAGIIQGLEGSHGLRGWRWLFIVEGAATIGVAFIAAFILPDFPATSKGFSERERSIAVARLSDDITAMTVDSEQLSPWRAMAESVKEWRTWMFVIGYMVIVGSSTLTYFYPTLVAGLFGNASTQKTNLLTVPIYAAAFVCTIITAWVSDKVPSWRGLIIAGWLAFSLACSIAVCTVYDYTARYALLVLMASGLWTTNGGTLAYASSSFGNMHPQTRGVSLALVNALGNLAQIYGSYLFPDSDSPKYIMGFSVISAMLAVGVVVFLALHVWFRRRASSASATD